MTTINNIADLAKILKEQPEWADTIRSLLLSEELLNLPARFADFVELQLEANRLTNERLDRLENQMGRLDSRMDGLDSRMDRLDSRMDGLDSRMDRLEGKFGNFEGRDYERGVRTRALVRAQHNLGLTDPYLALTQDGLVAPQFNRVIAQAIQNGSITLEQSEDLHEADIIISAQGNHHITIEVTLTADYDDIRRARRRADLLNSASGGAVIPAIITANLNDAQLQQAAAEQVATFVIPYP